MDHTGFAPTHGVCISQSTLLSLQVALQGNFPKQALDFLYFLGLSYSGLGSTKVLSLVQFSSVTQLCPTLCEPMNHSMPGLPVHHQLLEFTQTHTH